jgi:sugar phosphate isomerase/epimerase
VAGRPLEPLLDAAAEAGFASVGLDTLTVGDRTPEEVAAALGARGLVCTDLGVVALGRGDAVHVAARLADLAAATGCGVAVAALAAGLDRDAAHAELAACARILEPAGVRIALEPTSYGVRIPPAGAVALCDRVGWSRCGLLVDSWHVVRGGWPWPLLETLGDDRIVFVHLNDGGASPGDDPVREGRFDRLPPGAGSFPLARLLATLERLGYRGPLGLEVLSAELRALQPSEAARILYAGGIELLTDLS